MIFDFTRQDSPQDPYEFEEGLQNYLMPLPRGGTHLQEFDWNRQLLDDLARVSLTTGGAESRARLGVRLRGLIGEALLVELNRMAATAQPTHLLVRSNAAEIYALPWEMMTIDGSGLTVAERRMLRIAYTWPETRSTPDNCDPPDGGGRILVACSNEYGLVPDNAHSRAIKEHLDSIGLAFSPQRDLLRNATLHDIKAAIRQDGPPVRVLHILCHGGMGADGPGLALADGLATAEALRAALAFASASVRLIVLCACESGRDAGPGKWLGSVAMGLHRAGFSAVLASRTPLSVPGSVVLTDALYARLLRGMAAVDDAVDAAREALIDAGHLLDAQGLLLFCRPEDRTVRPITLRPYRGLLAFDEHSAALFHGRERESNELAERVSAAIEGKAPTLQLLVGTSGSGKSSLVFAGVVPRVRKQRPGLRILSVRTAGMHLLQRLAEVLSLPDSSNEDTVFAAVTANRPVLLIVDQLEELLLAPDAQSQISLLLRLVDSPCVVGLATLRIDFLGALSGVCGADGARLDQRLFGPESLTLLAQMAPDGLRLALEAPARQVGLSVEAGLAELALREAGNSAAALPLLEVALDALWRRRTAGGLTIEGWLKLGGLDGVLVRLADGAIDNMSTEARDEVRHLLMRMVRPGDGDWPITRRRLIVSNDLRIKIDAALGTLVAARLVVTGAEGDKIWAEICHDALLQHWPVLQSWVNEEREDLIQIGRLLEDEARWRTCEDPMSRADYLLHGSRLRAALKLYRRHADSIPAAVWDWLAICTDVKHAKAMEKRKQLRMERRRRSAERRAKDRQLMLRAGSANPDDATSLLAKVSNPSSVPGWTELSNELLNLRLILPPLRAPAGLRKEPLDWIRMFPKTGGVLGALLQAMATLREVSSPDRTWTARLHLGHIEAGPIDAPPSFRWEVPGAAIDAAFSNGGARLVASTGKQVVVWSMAPSRVLGWLHVDTYRAVDISDDGNRVMVAKPDQIIVYDVVPTKAAFGVKISRVWRSAGLRLVSQINQMPSLQASLSPDGQSVIAQIDTDTLLLWRVGAPLGTKVRCREAIKTLGFSSISGAPIVETRSGWKVVRCGRMTPTSSQSHITGVCLATSHGLTLGRVNGRLSIWGAGPAYVLSSHPPEHPRHVLFLRTGHILVSSHPETKYPSSALRFQPVESCDLA